MGGVRHVRLIGGRLPAVLVVSLAFGCESSPLRVERPAEGAVGASSTPKPFSGTQLNGGAHDPATKVY